MPTLPAVMATLLLPFERLFDPRTWRKAQLLAMGAILSPGKRTVSSALNILGIGQHGDFAIFHQVLNRARWSPLQLSRALLLLVAGHLGSSTEPLVFGIDETVERRWGRKIAAKGRYRDPVRSKDDQVVMTPGLQWVSLMLLTRIGWAGRHWALPFLTALVPSARYDRRKGRRHKTVTDYAQQMLVCLRGGCRRGTWWWWPMAATPSGSSCGIARVCQSRLSSSPNCARTRPGTSPRQRGGPARSGGPGWSARDCPVPRRCWTIPLPNGPLPHGPPYRATGSDGSTTMVELASGVALWYHGRPPRPPIRWVVVRYLAERRGPYALLCTDIAAEPPCGYCSGICCGGRSR